MSTELQSSKDFPSAQATFLQAHAAYRAGRHREADRFFGEVIRLCPNHLDALGQLAGLALDAGHAAWGVELIIKTIELKPDLAQSHANLGYALSLLSRFDEAEISYGRAVVLQPHFSEAHYSRGVMRDALQRYEEAVASYDEAIRFNPLYQAAHTNRANALYELKRFEEALAGYDRVIAAAPGDALLHYNRGNSLCALKRYEDAVASFRAALALNNEHALSHNNLGIALHELGDHGAAISSFDRAIVLKPDFAEAHANRAVTFSDTKHYAEALAGYELAIELNPTFAKAHYGRGITLNELKRFEGALDSYARAFALAPDSPFLLGKLIHMKMAVCEWEGLDKLRAELVRRITRGETATPPFQALATVDAPELHRKAAEIYVADAQRFAPVLPPIRKYPRREQIRIGYFSADLHDHATAILMAELFERHDRARFALTAFSFGRDTDDPMRRRLRSSFDHFVDVRDRTDKEIALLARDLEVDIAVDLKGYTGDGRHRIFSWRAAPIQVSYLGYPGTMGANFVDYLIADKVIIPPDCRSHYSEKIVTLPNTYQPNDTMRPIAEGKLSRAEVGLPEDAFVFCCFNNSYKITPETFGCWMRILAQVEHGVLWLLMDNPRAADNLRTEAARRGMGPERLIFAPRTDQLTHLARHRLADIFLDTLPYNAHTTASDALWMGLPVLTQRGESFAGRVAASLLKAIDLSELITHTAREYEEMAISFGHDPARLEVIRKQLVRNRRVMPLFDTPRLTKAIESAYSEMFERYHAGLPPDHIDVESA